LNQIGIPEPDSGDNDLDTGAHAPEGGGRAGAGLNVLKRAAGLVGAGYGDSRLLAAWRRARKSRPGRRERVVHLSLRIAFDLDGVLADMEAELVRQTEILFGEAMTRMLQEPARSGQEAASSTTTSAGGRGSPGPAAEPASTPVADGAPRLVRLRLTGRQERRLWRHVQSIDGFWESLKEIEPGIVARLAALSAERRWEVIFLTKRPETAGAIAQVQTQRWLQARGFPLPSVFVVQGSRGRVAESLALDFVVDDRPENCLDVMVDSKARAILVWREDEKDLPVTVKRLGLGVVKSVDECLGILSKVDAANKARPGLVDRMIRRLGLKEPASV
jgi:hypothetical protein